jgi:hypothetical protein
VCSRHTTPFAKCPFSVLCLLFSFSWVLGVILSRGLCCFYPRGGCGSTACHLFAHLLVCISQASLEPVSGSLGALLVS